MTNYGIVQDMYTVDRQKANIQLTVHSSKKLWNVVNFKIGGWGISGKQDKSRFQIKKGICCFWNQVKFLTSQRPLLEGW